MHRAILGIVFAALCFALPQRAVAGPIYSCPSGSAECAGQTFALWIVEEGAGYFDVAVSIDTTGYKGRTAGSAGDYAYGVEVKNLIASNVIYDSVSLLAAPGGITDWNTYTKQLSQDCELSDGNHKDMACASWGATGAGYMFVVGDILTWVFHVETPVALDSDGIGHIKYEYLAVDGSHAAGLLSQDITLQDCQDGLCDPPVVVPEPGTLALVGLGLLSAAVVVRRRR